VSLLEQSLAAAGVGPDKQPVYPLVIAARKDPETGAMVDRHLARSYVIMVGLDHR
jgi:hypothetical protein